MRPTSSYAGRVRALLLAGALGASGLVTLASGTATAGAEDKKAEAFKEITLEITGMT